MVVSVSATDSCGNTQGASTVISVFAPNADFDFRYITNAKLKFTPTFSSDITSWIWDFGDGSVSTEEAPVHLYQDTGLYQVTLIAFNDFGCADTVIKNVRAYPPYAFYIPNAYTPNSDGLNEVYRGKGQGFIRYEMFIFDRWGLEIYRTADISRGWTGIDDQGRPFPLGVYVYKVSLETPVGDVYEYSGRVSLIR
jgi:gliding motility-associated-like protein